MSELSLVNFSVAITISDPWEFGTECGVGPFIGTVTDATVDKLIISLSNPINYRGKTLRTAIARPRHTGNENQKIAFSVMSSNLLLLPCNIRLVSELLPDMTKDGIAAIGTLERYLQESES